MEIHNINPDYLTAILLGSSKIVYESFLKIVIKLGGAQRRSGPSPDWIVWFILCNGTQGSEITQLRFFEVS